MVMQKPHEETIRAKVLKVEPSSVDDMPAGSGKKFELEIVLGSGSHYNVGEILGRRDEQVVCGYDQHLAPGIKVGDTVDFTVKARFDEIGGVDRYHVSSPERHGQRKETEPQG